MEKFTSGVVQFDIATGDVDANMAAAMEHLNSLADKGADLAVLPEMFSTGFDNAHIRDLALRTPETLAQLAGFAKKRGMALAGSFPLLDGQKVFNTLYVIDRDGEILGEYRKLHLFRLTDEHKFYAPGSRMVHVKTSLGTLGLMICYDVRFPELARSLTLSGAKVLIVPAQWPKARADHWTTLIRARAIENQVYVIAANRTGTDDALVFPGLSSIISPSGLVLACAGEDDGTALAVVDPGDVDAVRKQIPVMSDRRKDIYG